MSIKLNLQEPEETGNFLRSSGIIAADEQLDTLTLAGEGNMNLTLRAVISSPSGSKSLILKQANPFVQKYPTIAAPVSRSAMEATFFRLSAKIEGVKKYLPNLIHFDADSHILVMEDLGKAGDCTLYYAKDKILENDKILDMIGFLAELHKGSKNSETVVNKEMRELNHIHIFDLPFQRDNSLDLNAVQPGLAALANETIFAHPKISAKAKNLGSMYLSASGPCLLHGDFFPGSWMVTTNGLRVIDPEFCFSGPAEFDLGVMMAHLRFCRISPFQITTFFKSYGSFDLSLARNFMAIEILRRFFGVAQLPLDSSIDQKRELTEEAIQILKQ